MSSTPEGDRPSGASAEETRRKERELAETEMKVARRERIADRLLILRILFVLVELVTGNPAYRWAARSVEWVVEHLRES